MTEKSGSTHSIFDPESKHSRMRTCVRAEDKMRGYFHYLWAMLKREKEPQPVPEGLSREKGLRWARWLAGMHGSVSSVAFSPDGRRIVTGSRDNTALVWDAEKGTELFAVEHGPDFLVLDTWHAKTVVLLPGQEDMPSAREYRSNIDLCLVREADGKLTLGGLTDLFRDLELAERDLHWQLRRWLHSSLRCRAFLLEPEVIAQLQAVLGDRPWTDAFLAQTVADNFDVAQILAAIPEMEGTSRRRYEIVFHRVPVSERYNTLPPRRQPLQVVIVLDPAMVDADE